MTSTQRGLREKDIENNYWYLRWNVYSYEWESYILCICIYI